ncbi:MAG: M3 family metallopeptidase [Puniceicoccales bacterium]|jgi:oligopeptidase A|nr:M3 family metallopeptidase [Puniceicoccales bacterium]
MKQLALMVLFFICNFLEAGQVKKNYHPFLADDEPIKWHTLLPEYIESDISLAIELSQKNIDEIASLPLNKLTFKNTIIALEKATDPLDVAWGYVSHLDATCNSNELREEHNKMLPRVAKFSANILLNDALWLRIKTFAEMEEAQNLRGIDKKLLNDTLDSFRDIGADLPRKRRERIVEINIELSQKAQKFAENVLDSRNAWERYVDDVEELKGLPSITVDVLREDAKAHGREGYRISLNPSTSGKCMQYLESEKLREEIFRASLTVGHKDPYGNQKLVEDILRLRDEKAKILGHKTYADYALKRRMAKNGSTALSFVENLHDRTRKFFVRDIDDMENFRAEFRGVEKSRLVPWETSYVLEKFRQARFDFDEEQLRPYFRLENVIAGLFEVANRLYGIKFVEQPTFFTKNGNDVPPGKAIPVWHGDVKYFKAFEENGTYIGGLYMDIHPRESKHAGGWMSDTKSGYLDENGIWHYPTATICTNLTPSTEDTPSLLSHREVETLFHEFGHALHHLFGKVKYASMNGANTAWDFVELPSQIMENFCWERESLDIFAKHFETGEKIPEELFKKMIAAKNFMSGSGMMGQLCFAKLDLELHQKYENYANKNIEDQLKQVLETYRVTTSEYVPTITLSFKHIFGGGYSAGYYSYKWAEVLDADAFNKFKEHGVLSREVGNEFREKILSRGDSDEADVLYRDFMGRDPAIEPLFIRSGLVD